MGTFIGFPDEVIEQILAGLPARDVLACAAVSSLEITLGIIV